jgi:2,3-bisphosphoglycerate-dependent phosphoglycerate mutase
MRKFLLLFIPFLISCNSETDQNNQTMDQKSAQEVTKYYFIRHAEKDTSDPDDRDPKLTQEGVARSQNWSRVFKEVDFDIIYSSNYKRTTATAKAVADARQKDVSIYDASKLNDEEFQKNTQGKTVLVVGHSDSNPKFVNYILEDEKYSDIDDSESGSLFIVSKFPDGTVTSDVLYIN